MATYTPKTSEIERAWHVVDAEGLVLGRMCTEVARILASYNLVSLPVVDADDHLLGAVTVDDLIDHMLPEDWRDTGSAS